MAKEGYKPGGTWGIDDRTGFKVRLRDLRKEWTGYRVDDPDRRNPQEFVRGRAERISVPDPRPEPADTFVSTNEVTAEDL